MNWVNERRDESLEELQVQYDRLVDMAEEHGLNAGVFDGRIPVATHVERGVNEADQVRQLLAKKGSFFCLSIVECLWNKDWKCERCPASTTRAACIGWGKNCGAIAD